MRRRLRLWVLALVALALPAQGMVAAMMTLCGPMHHHMATAYDNAADVSHVHNDGDRHRHVVGDLGNSNNSNATAQPGDFSQLVKFSCSACSACCSGVAAVSSSSPRSPFPSSDGVILSLQPRFSGFISEGPYHPPRTILA